MTKQFRLIMLLVVVLVSAIPFLSQKFSWIRGDFFEVINVADGDTIDVLMSGNIESVRFIGIDTPETHHPDIGEQCFGQEATDSLNSLITDKVQLVMDPDSTNRDRYGRLLRFVYNQDGVFLNLEQVRRGYAFATTSFRHSLMQVFVTAELLASHENVGVWSGCEINFNNGYPQTQTLSSNIMNVE